MGHKTTNSRDTDRHEKLLVDTERVVVTSNLLFEMRMDENSKMNLILCRARPNSVGLPHSKI